MYYFYYIMSYIFNLTISLATSANLLLIDQMVFCHIAKTFHKFVSADGRLYQIL